MRSYAGIGARATPSHVLEQFKLIGQLLATRDWMLHSGGADGADEAFHDGAKLITTNSVIRTAQEAKRYPYWLKHAREYHPNWEACSNFTRLLHARNSAIMLGAALSTPRDMVVCWTPGGEIVGGTGQALRIAKDWKIPVFNFAKPNDVASFWEFVS